MLLGAVQGFVRRAQQVGAVHGVQRIERYSAGEAELKPFSAGRGSCIFQVIEQFPTRWGGWQVDLAIKVNYRSGSQKSVERRLRPVPESSRRTWSPRRDRSLTCLTVQVHHNDGESPVRRGLPGPSRSSSAWRFGAR
jgi:hypothetical protein